MRGLVQCPYADTSGYPRTPRSAFMARACHCKCMTNVHFFQMVDLARCLQDPQYTLPQKESPMKTERALMCLLFTLCVLLVLGALTTLMTTHAPAVDTVQLAHAASTSLRSG